MAERNQIREIVFAAIEGVNELLLEEDSVQKDEETILLGDNAALDSMGFVNFVVALEQEYADRLGLPINLTEQLNSTSAGSPQVSTVRQLIDFLHESLKG